MRTIPFKRKLKTKQNSGTRGPKETSVPCPGTLLLAFESPALYIASSIFLLYVSYGSILHNEKASHYATHAIGMLRDIFAGAY